MSTAFHPKSDGQSEVTIRTLENFLRPYVVNNPQEWVQQLHLAEFAANNAVNVAIGYSTFYLMYGQHVNWPLTLADQLRDREGQGEAVKVMLKRMQDVISDVQNHYKKAQDRMRDVANKKRKDVKLSVGDEVLIKTAFLPQSAFAQIPVKIRRRFVGPFKVNKVISSVAYGIELPTQWRVHDTVVLDNRG